MYKLNLVNFSKNQYGWSSAIYIAVAVKFDIECVVIEIRRAKSDRNSNNAAKFYGYPFLFGRNFLRSLVN